MLSALISLEVPVDDGNNYNGTYLREGNVRVSNLSCWFRDQETCSPGPVTNHALAHAYGETILELDSTNYSEIADVVKSKKDHRYYFRNDRQEFAYRFNEYNPHDNQSVYPHFTNRTISVSAGECRVYDQVGKGVSISLWDMNATKFTYNDSTVQGGIIRIPTPYLGLEGTTYIYRDTKVPAQASMEAYGPRGLWMWAYKNPGKSNDPKFYRCPITVSNVSNVNAGDDHHHVPDYIARGATASIALQGQWHGLKDNPDWRQYQFYASG